MIGSLEPRVDEEGALDGVSNQTQTKDSYNQLVKMKQKIFSKGRDEMTANTEKKNLKIRTKFPPSFLPLISSEEGKIMK